MQKYPMTVAGEKALREELEQLRRVTRPRIVASIAEARAHGDLKENAEYHAAREQQGFCEGRIQEIEAKLSTAQVIDITSIPQGDRVLFGATVDLVNVQTGQTITYKIVGEDEADVKKNKISVTSPIARAVIGKEIGETAVVKAPSGDVEYEVDDVRHL